MHRYLASIFNESEIETAIQDAFKFNYNSCDLYKEYCDSINKNYSENIKIEDIPFLPISFFKNHKIQSNQKSKSKLFLSSGTTGKKSKHYVTDLNIYNHSLINSFKYAFGDPKKFHFIGVTPSPEERKNSSLIYMIDKLQSYSKNEGFFSSNSEEFKIKIKKIQKSKSEIIVFGLSHMLLEFIENKKIKLNNCIVIETGGMKGNREEIEKKKLHEILSNGYGTDKIFSEYGMTELLSQSYTIKDDIFRPPPWKKVLIRDFNDPFKIKKIGRGIINIIDLANINSCCFISTEDIGEVFKDGSFKIYGRANESDIRGCNNMLLDIN
jgi:phenylacetate-coenzyme A ligase PaaK-like adenylate-forming protein